MPNIVTQRHEWAIEHSAGVNLQATITRAAEPNGRHVCKSITVTMGGTANSAAKTARIRDGLSGGGTPLWSATIFTLANDTKIINLAGLNIVGSKNTAMTLEWNSAPGANLQQSVSISGYTETDVVQNPG